MSFTVSVVVPARFAASLLPQCLRAINGGTRVPDELIVVEDGPTGDGTPEIARAAGATLISLPQRLGPAAARNAGALHARGEVLVFVDADVVIRPDALAHLVDALASEPDVDAVFGSYDTAPPRLNLASQYKNLLHHFVHQRGLEEASTFWAGLGAVRRRAFEAVGGFDAARYGRPSVEDIELGLRLCASGRRVKLVKAAQGSHLKRWTAAGVFRTDLLDRASPWTELILASGRMPDDLNLGLRHRIGVASTTAGLVSLLPIGFEPLLFPLPLAALFVTLAVSGDVLVFFARERGVVFAVRTIPLHLGYYAAAGLGFGLGLARHLTRPLRASGVLRAASPPSAGSDPRVKSHSAHSL